MGTGVLRGNFLSRFLEPKPRIIPGLSPNYIDLINKKRMELDSIKQNGRPTPKTYTL